MRILIAEDDPVSALLLNKIVAPLGEVVTVKNGEEAYNQYCDSIEQGRPFELALFDIMMPEVDGQEALSAIREFEQESNIPEEQCLKVIIVTALDDADNIYLAHRSRCTDYITKPVTKERILSALAKLNLTPPA